MESELSGMGMIDIDIGTPESIDALETYKSAQLPTVYVTYKRRWLVLGLFVFYSASSAMQWIQYSIIADIIMKYYDISSDLVNWTSMVYMITYIPLIFPASWLLDRVMGGVGMTDVDFGTTESIDALETYKSAQLPTVYVTYKRRWLVLGLFVFYSASNALQWIQYAIIADIIMKYYDTSSDLVNWTSMVYMATYIPLIFPASWLLDRVGLRVTTIIGALGTCAGAWLKVGSVDPSRFWLGFTGQTVVAVSQVFVLNVPPRLAAVWFGPGQVSSACSIGVFGNQLGVAAGFLLSPILVRNSDDLAAIGKDLQLLFYIVAGITTVLLVLILLLFKAAPPTPPSAAQDFESDNSEFLQSVKRLFLNRNYVLLLISYGMNVGIFYAISTLLNQVILIYYPGANEDAGRIGVLIVVAGMAGSVMCGLILDKTHRFKETTFAIYAASVIGMVIFTFTLNAGIVAVYISSLLLGFFMTGYLPVGFEFASEVTYPEPEGTTSGILNAVAQVFGIVLTILYSKLLVAIGDQWANIVLCALLVVGTVITALIKSDLRRQAAQGPA